jgi:type I restriction enzyme S subunit
VTQIIQSGYQQTDVGIIPEDWEVIKLNDCLELLTDFEANGGFADLANNVKTYDSENYAWYVRATDLENHSTLNDLRWVDEKSYKFLRKTSLYGGELLITKRGEIGKVYLFCSKTKFATLGPNLYLLKLNDKSCPKFLYYYFKYGYGNNLLKINNASTTLGALYKNDIKAIPIPYPDLKEQSFISKVLSDADVLIESLDNLIEKKKNIKQGAMQQLLTGKKRLSGFSEEWEAKRLGEIADVYNGGTPRTSIKEYWDGSIYWCIPTDITKTKGKYLLGTERKITEAGLENSSAKLLPIGSLLLCSRATIGESFVLKKWIVNLYITSC